MRVKNLETLVLRGVTVACDCVTGLKGIGSNLAAQMPAMDLSHLRHPSQSDPQAGMDTGPRYWRAEPSGAASAVERAGRPGRSSGVLVRRNPAINAGRAILSGWSLATGEPFPTAAWCIGRFSPASPAAVEQAHRLRFPERSQPFPATALTPGGPASQPRGDRAQKRRQGTKAWLTATGTSSASTRGKRGGD